MNSLRARPFRFFHLSVLLALVLSTVALTQTARASGVIRYVTPNPMDRVDCSSWALACDLQTALRFANSGDQIWVRQGVHKPATTADRNASFALKNGVAIYGGFAGTETALSQRNLS